ncbi:hypothetical protein E2562_032018 [Oryza meyeriana var. granulata]|uniref:Uncharacterized protein n=1 Tax=Oryza meyeriana var. granulata TaxID=110450 RepID=A0A6G1FEN8_9ORYZ|nr:hypothetical protein E2562_032018 [Oryza meyeriana var. granulata]
MQIWRPGVGRRGKSDGLAVDLASLLHPLRLLRRGSRVWDGDLAAEVVGRPAAEGLMGRGRRPSGGGGREAGKLGGRGAGMVGELGDGGVGRSLSLR